MSTDHDGDLEMAISQQSQSQPHAELKHDATSWNALSTPSMPVLQQIQHWQSPGNILLEIYSTYQSQPMHGRRGVKRKQPDSAHIPEWEEIAELKRSLLGDENHPPVSGIPLTMVPGLKRGDEIDVCIFDKVLGRWEWVDGAIMTDPHDKKRNGTIVVHVPRHGPITAPLTSGIFAPHHTYGSRELKFAVYGSSDERGTVQTKTEGSIQNDTPYSKPSRRIMPGSRTSMPLKNGRLQNAIASKTKDWKNELGLGLESGLGLGGH